MEKKISPVASCMDTIMRHGLVKNKNPVYYIVGKRKYCKKEINKNA